MHGELASIDVAIVVQDLSRSGFSVVSQLSFAPGETLDFRLSSDAAAPVQVTAQSIRTHPIPDSPDLHFSGFMFVPGQLTGVVPQALVDQLIEAVSPVPSLL